MDRMNRVGRERSCRSCESCLDPNGIGGNAEVAEEFAEDRREHTACSPYPSLCPLHVGYCPDLFPWGGVCHGATPVETFTQLSEIVEDMVNTAQAQGLALPLPSTRPMREAVPA
jgi:hypothetical protein